MLKFAIVDDDQKTLKRVEDFARAYMQNADDSFQIKSFTKSINLISSILDGDRFDLYLLDVEMPGSSGIETAEVIRKLQPVAVIIFLTSYLQYAPKGYPVHALRYILKEKMDEELPEALGKALENLAEMDHSCLMVTHYGNVTRVRHKDIIYVRKDFRSVCIVTTEQGSLQDKRGIKVLFEELNDIRFTFTDRSCFINLNFALGIEGNWMVMKNGERLPISRPMMPKVKDAIMQLWGG